MWGHNLDGEDDVVLARSKGEGTPGWENWLASSCCRLRASVSPALSVHACIPLLPLPGHQPPAIDC